MPIHGNVAAKRNRPWEAQPLDLRDTDFRSAILSIFKELRKLCLNKYRKV